MIRTRRIGFSTSGATEFVDITSRVQDAITAGGLRHGRVHLQSLHTTLAVTVNENEPLLLADFETLLDRLAPRDAVYQHDDFGRRAGFLLARNSRYLKTSSAAMPVPRFFILR